MARPSWPVVLFALGGCSFALSGPDPSQPRSQEPRCDTEKTAVLGDGLLATAAGITTLAVGANSGGAAIVPAVIGAVFVGAAIHGNNTVNACRAAKEEYIASLHAPPPPDERADERAQVVRRAVVAPPVAATEPADVPASAAPAPAAPPAPAPAAAPQPPPAAEGPAWSAFWKEVR